MRKDLVNGTIVFIIGTLAYWGTYGFDRGETSISENPALYPQLLSLVLCLLGALLVITALAGRKIEPAPSLKKNTGKGRMMAVVLSLLGYSVGIYFFGFIIPSLLFMFGVPLQLGASRKTALLVSVPLTAALYVIFFLLFKVPIPHGIALR